MAKYSYAFKKKIVEAYLQGKGGQRYLAKIYGIPNKDKVKLWVNNYKEFGDKGLMRSRKKKEYSFEHKLNVVKLYLSSEVSYRELALQEGITNPSLLVKWVNDFRIAGADALRPKKKGRKKKLNSSNKKQNKKPVENTLVDTSDEYVRQLEDEILKLKIENTYLKELRRLRLEEKTLLKKKRESSTVSEENSN